MLECCIMQVRINGRKKYGRLYPLLRTGHLSCSNMGMDCTSSNSKSNRILKEALQRSCDPMILNVIGKNYQQMGDCLSAEDKFIRSPIGCRDVFTLITCLRNFMRNQASGNRTSLKNEVDGIDERAESAFCDNTTDEGEIKDSACLSILKR